MVIPGWLQFNHEGVGPVVIKCVLSTTHIIETKEGSQVIVKPLVSLGTWFGKVKCIVVEKPIVKPTTRSKSSFGIPKQEGQQPSNKGVDLRQTH